MAAKHTKLTNMCNIILSLSFTDIISRPFGWQSSAALKVKLICYLL